MCISIKSVDDGGVRQLPSTLFLPVQECLHITQKLRNTRVCVSGMSINILNACLRFCVIHSWNSFLWSAQSQKQISNHDFLNNATSEPTGMEINWMMAKCNENIQICTICIGNAISNIHEDCGHDQMICFANLNLHWPTPVVPF